MKKCTCTAWIQGHGLGDRIPLEVVESLTTQPNKRSVQWVPTSSQQGPLFLQAKLIISFWPSRKDCISDKLWAYAIILQSCSPTKKSILSKYAFEEKNPRPLQFTPTKIILDKPHILNPSDLWMLLDNSATSIKVWHVKSSRALCCLIWLLKRQRLNLWFIEIRNKLKEVKVSSRWHTELLRGQ